MTIKTTLNIIFMVTILAGVFLLKFGLERDMKGHSSVQEPGQGGKQTGELVDNDELQLMVPDVVLTTFNGATTTRTDKILSYYGTSSKDSSNNFSEHLLERSLLYGKYQTKTILYWTTKYHEDWTKSSEVGSAPFENCQYSRCEVSGDKSKLFSADMLLFFNRDQPNFPRKRIQSQLYVHVDVDPPLAPGKTYLEEFEDQINLTMNYRKDADMYRPNIRFIKKDVPTDRYIPHVPLLKKTRSVVWMVSHCITLSQREVYVKELRKYIDVDIYGKCGNMTCPQRIGNKECFMNFEERYKFYLSFENSFCKDYFTEKLKHPLQFELVPVVLGLPDYYEDVGVPPHSVINAQDFKTPKDLGEYLHYVSSNETEYYKYFEWKATHYIIQRESYFCFLCEALHTDRYKRDGVIQPSYKRSKAGNYREWFQGACEHDRMNKLRAVGNW